LIEAAAAGVPIVTTDVGISQELTDKNGIIIPVADSEALQAAILSVVEGKFIFAKAAIHTQSKEEFLSGMVAGWEACLK
jgi:glycosyltransferase involved in cell wall biosynthesis